MSSATLTPGQLQGQIQQLQGQIQGQIQGQKQLQQQQQQQNRMMVIPPASSAAAALEANSYIDDSIDSIMMGPMSSTYIDHHVPQAQGSPAHSMR